MAATERTVTRSELTASIHRMTEHDLLEVCQIEALSDLSEWGWEAYHKELQSFEDTIMLVARVDSTYKEFEVAGFIVARLIAGELHINNVAVRPEFRRYGVGSELLQATLAKAREAGAVIAHLEVRAGNIAAQGLYSRCDFEVMGRRKNYYRQPTEDALLMSLSWKSSS